MRTERSSSPSTGVDDRMGYECVGMGEWQYECVSMGILQ